MKIAVIFSNGTEEIEGITAVDVFRRAGAECDIVSIDGEVLNCSRKIKVVADRHIDQVNLDDYSAIVIPGGMPGASNISNCEKVINALGSALNKGKVVGAICAAPAVVLAANKLIKDRKVTCYPAKDFIEMMGENIYTGNGVEVDGNLITANGPESALEFALAICSRLKITPKF